MDKNEIDLAIRTVGLALNACHNTVTTDKPGIIPDELSWKIDNSAAIKSLDSLEKFISAYIEKAPDMPSETVVNEF
jgi:hypothetical protein